MKKINVIIFCILIFSFLTSMKVLSATYKIEDTFDGCEHGKYYPLTNGNYLRCDQYKYFYKYRPDVIADGNKVYAIDGREVRGTIVQGTTINTQINGEWEGCDFDTHPLTNGYYLSCNSYFYEYAYMPRVEILVIDGDVKSVKINGDTKDGVSVFAP
jgi:hypothetical protein